MNAYLQLARPQQWIKSSFLLIPVPFALAAGARFDIASFGMGLLGFSLLSSAVYALNDVIDRERDRSNPRKAMRPVARGALTARAALGASAVWLAAGFALLAFSGRSAVVAPGVAYFLVQIFYSFGGKHVPILDVFILSSGFLLRVLAGCALVEAEPSQWILLCSSGLALFLALGKRRVDLVDGLGVDQRPSLRGYTVPFVDQALAVVAGVTLLAYALYCREAPVFRPGREFWSVPFAAAGLLEYLRLLHRENREPTDLIVSCPTLWALGIAWLIAVAGGLTSVT